MHTDARLQGDVSSGLDFRFRPKYTWGMINRPGIKKFSLIFTVFFLLTSESIGGGLGTKAKDAPFIMKDGIINLNHIVVNKVRREIRMTVQLALEAGILEFFLVADHGKTYESTFKIADNSPSDLNFALLLIGCRPLPFDRFEHLTRQKDGLDRLLQDHKSAVLDIEIQKDGKPIPFYQILTDRESQDKAPVWVHTGSYFLPGNRYAADLEAGYIGIWPNERMVVNLFSAHRNPYRGDFGFEMQPGLRVDEEYELVIRRR